MIQRAHLGVGIMGKEGNQASQFADFAINQFQDLRKLMFWHGNNFAVKILIMVILQMQKTIVFGLSSFLYNAFAGYSGVNVITNLLWACFSLVLTVYMWYSFFEQAVSFKDYYRDESKLTFKMSHHYKYQRDIWIKKFKRWFYLWFLVSAYAATISLVLPFFAYTEGSNKKGTGQWCCGYVNYWLCIIFCHLLFICFFKHINRPTFIILFVLYVSFWLVSWQQDSISSDNLYKNITTEIWPDPKVWLVILVAIVGMSLPLLAFRVFRDLIFYPEFN